MIGIKALQQSSTPRTLHLACQCISFPMNTHLLSKQLFWWRLEGLQVASLLFNNRDSCFHMSGAYILSSASHRISVWLNSLFRAGHCYGHCSLSIGDALLCIRSILTSSNKNVQIHWNKFITSSRGLILKQTFISDLGGLRPVLGYEMYKNWILK